MLGLVAVSLLWGCSSVLIKIALPGVPPDTVAFARVALGAAVLLPALLLRGHRLPRARDLGHLTVLALTLAVVPFTLTAWGEQRVTSELTAVLHATIPLCTAAWAALLLGQKLRWSHAAALAAGLLGIAVLSGFTTGCLDAVSWTGALAVLASSASYGLGYTYLRRHLAHLAPLQVAAGVQLTAAVLLLPLAGSELATTRLDLTPARLASLVLLGTVCTGAAQLLNYRNIERLGPTTASLSTYLIPLVGVTASIAELAEPLTPRLAAGTALILTAITITRHRP
ncbi:DMT family transporter, partial [Streptacidiphilus carbonis]|uniref:DMT family transporter n=1 Tax=Streptacidiphilus carbonis TaxID=105422 RepID=UPI0005A90ED7